MEPCQRRTSQPPHRSERKPFRTIVPSILLALAAPGCGISGSSNESSLPSARATQVVASSQHSCALTTEGGVRCWGVNELGQLGAGSNDVLDPGNENLGKRFLAVQVTGLERGVTAITTENSGSHTCALTSAGGVKCWGDNAKGQLGNGTSASSSVPVDVMGLTSGVSAIVAGFEHTCALTTAGGVKCWGANESGQLGTGSVTPSSVPVDVTGLPSGVTALALGTAHSCALTSAGGVTCWGHNSNGECGTSKDILDVQVPTPVAALPSGIKKIVAGGRNTCALTTAGGAKCWGSNHDGQLGNDAGGGNIFDEDAPVDVVGLSTGVIELRPSFEFAMALVGDRVKVWGKFGGGDHPIRAMTPVDSVVTSGASQLSTGLLHACVVSTAGAVSCWGDNLSGQVGLFEPGDGVWYEETPVPVSSLP